MILAGLRGTRLSGVTDSESEPNDLGLVKVAEPTADAIGQSMSWISLHRRADGTPR